MRTFGKESAWRTPGLRGHEQALACVERLLGAAPARLELPRRRAVGGDEVLAEQPGHRAAKPVDGLVRVADHDEAGAGVRRGDQPHELELSRVHVLELN